MALPEQVNFSILTTTQAAGFIKEAPQGESILILVPGPAEVLSLIEAGACFKSVNVGGLHYSAGRVQLGKAVFLSDADRAALRKIAKHGVALEGRGLPGDNADDILGLMEGGA
jgi:mannose/fructose/N-acetylgalactosamine-specific phosphotransferase system component IIB